MMDRFLQKTSFKEEEIEQAIVNALEASSQTADFDTAIKVMAIKGIAPQLGMRIMNLLPIVAGRMLMKSTGMIPRLANHYIIFDKQGKCTQVLFDTCPFARTIKARLEKLPGSEVTIGTGSCEMLALNEALHRLGPNANATAVARVQILAPEMGGEILHANVQGAAGDFDDLILNDEIMKIRCTCGSILDVPKSASGSVISSPCCGAQLKVQPKIPALPAHKRLPPASPTPVAVSASSAAITVDCQCGQELRVSNPAPGKLFRCPKCDRQFRVG